MRIPRRLMAEFNANCRSGGGGNEWNVIRQYASDVYATGPSKNIK